MTWTPGSAVTPPLTIPAGNSVTVTVKFTPTVAGARTGSLGIVSNAPSSPDALPLSGTGTSGTTPAPAVSLSVTSLTFPSTAVG